VVKHCIFFIALLYSVFLGWLQAQPSNEGCIGCSFDQFNVHASDVNEDWYLRDVQHTDKYTILIIDIYARDNERRRFFFQRSSYITVKHLTGYINPVKWEVGDTEYPIGETLYFPKNSKDKYYRNKLYFPRIPAGYNYFSFYMSSLIRWEDIYKDNPNTTKQTAYYEQALLDHWKQIGSKGIEGIYQCSKVSGEATMSNKIRVGLLYDTKTSAYDVIVLNAHDFWKVGEVIGELSPTAKEGIFIANYWRNRNKVPIEGHLYAANSTTELMIATDDAMAEFVKLYPSTYTEQEIVSQWSGTGWALGEAYVVTNNHVAEGARTITIKGVGGNYNIGYDAEVVTTDKVNDIAVLKIVDNRFNGFGNLPYGVTSRIADVGEDVFVLGFPLGRQFLGDEIKLTSGIINSRTGFGDYQNCYQIQAPITHGNSGGPVFDSKGNVIGIVVGGLNKELNLAENVGYAIKTSYLKILIENAGLGISQLNNNSISTLSLPEKVKRVKNFVFYIECSK